MFAVDGQELTGPCKRGDELASDDERLLVGERERLARAQSGHRRAKARGADERVQHEIHFGM